MRSVSLYKSVNQFLVFQLQGIIMSTSQIMFEGNIPAWVLDEVTRYGAATNESGDHYLNLEDLNEGVKPSIILQKLIKKAEQAGCTTLKLYK